MKKSHQLRRFRLGIAASFLAMFPSCVQTPNAGHGDIRDWLLGRRHRDLIPKTPEDSVLALAREVTILEDELRRDGTITIKQPDVWGDGNLVHFIQEHDRLLAESVKNFEETVQAYIARSDQADLQATNSVAQGLGGTPAAEAPTTNLIDIQNTDAFQALKTAFDTLPTPKGGGVGVEPTELERQRSTYILVNQSLRRRVSGDDNSRAAGYGLYKFRIPVSILPGRETTEGWSGVVSLRARLEVDAANMKFTFPKLVIAEIVELLTPRIEAEWNKEISTEAFLPGSQGRARPDVSRLVGTPTAPPARGEFHGKASVDALRAAAQEYFAMLHGEDFKPATMELRTFLFSYLAQVHNIIEKRGSFTQQTELLDTAMLQLEKGQFITGKNENDLRGIWITTFAPSGALADSHLASVSWIVAIHSAILDRNLKKIIGEIRLRNSGHAGADGLEELVRFYAPELAPAETLQLWQHIIAEEFPPYVFTLDPQWRSKTR
jgi:hypothetical protein